MKGNRKVIFHAVLFQTTAVLHRINFEAWLPRAGSAEAAGCVQPLHWPTARWHYSVSTWGSL